MIWISFILALHPSKLDYQVEVLALLIWGCLHLHQTNKCSICNTFYTKFPNIRETKEIGHVKINLNKVTIFNILQFFSVSDCLKSMIPRHWQTRGMFHGAALPGLCCIQSSLLACLRGFLPSAWSSGVKHMLRWIEMTDITSLVDLPVCYGQFSSCTVLKSGGYVKKVYETCTIYPIKMWKPSNTVNAKSQHSHCFISSPTWCSSEINKKNKNVSLQQHIWGIHQDFISAFYPKSYPYTLL